MCCRVFIHSALLTFWSSLNGNLSSFPFFILVVSFSCGRPTFSYLVVFFFINGNNGKWKKRSWNRRNEYERGRNSPSFELDAHYYMVYLIFLLWQHTQQKKKRCAIHETWTTRTVVCYRRNLSRSVIGGGDRGRLFLRRRWLGTSKRFNCPRFSKSTTSLFHSRMSLSLSLVKRISLNEEDVLV